MPDKIPNSGRSSLGAVDNVSFPRTEQHGDCVAVTTNRAQRILSTLDIPGNERKLETMRHALRVFIYQSLLLPDPPGQTQ